MTYRLFFFFLLVSTSLLAQKSTQEVELEYTAHYGQRELLTIEFYLKNNTNDTILIHRPRALKYRPNGHPPVPNIPDFYALNFLTAVTFCEIPPFFSDQGAGVPTKVERDFIKIAPLGQQQILFNTKQSEQMICDAEIEEVKVKLVYDFDERYLDRKIFEKEIAQEGKLSPQKSEQLYQLLKNSYHGTIESEEVVLDLKNLKKHGDPATQKAQAIRKAKRIYGLDMTDFIPSDYLGTVPAIQVKVDKDFEASKLEQLQRQVVSSLPHGSYFYTVVTQENSIKWFLTAESRRNSSVNIYDYNTVIDSVNLTVALIAAEKENSILKDMKIVNIFLPMQNMTTSSSGYVGKFALVILQDLEKNYFSLRLNRFPVYKTQLKPIVLSEDGWEWTEKATFSWTDDQVYLYRKLENGDLVYGQKEYWEKGLENGQSYFFLIK